MDFLTKLLPSSGFYCAAQLFPSGAWKNQFFENLASLHGHLELMDSRGATMYVAQASYRTAENRKGSNAGAFRNFFLDIDVGGSKPFATQLDALQALRAFVAATKLPFPSVVSSGYGLYAHWLLEEDLPAEKWKPLAKILKQLTIAHKFEVDQTRTADASSVLRPVGVHNRKHNAVKEVRLLIEQPATPLEVFASYLEAAATEAKVEHGVLLPPALPAGIADEFTSGLGGPPSDLEQVADRCAQIRAVRDKQGDVPEPHWYNFIGVARHCYEATDLIFAWSSGHPDYSPAETEKKIRHHEESGTGPTTCAKFGADDPKLCLACPYVNKIRSPIVLGRPDPEEIQDEVAEELVVPKGFLRTKEGLFLQTETVPTRFYPYDLYITGWQHDISAGHETITIRHSLPPDGHYHEFSIRSALINDPKQLLMTLGDNHVHIAGAESRKIMTAYIDHFMAELRSRKRKGSLSTQMGWVGEQGDLSFVLGPREVTLHGVQSVGFAKTVPEVAQAFTSRGELAPWVEATKYLGLPGMEPLAFTFLAGAFGAPLMRFTGFAGAMIALIGESGLGKTLMGEWILSTYGDPRRLQLFEKDTRNSLVTRLGLYGSLPLFIDEVSNITAQDLSDLVYRVTQGRDKLRLNRAGKEREGVNQWNTTAVVSSNHSLADKLSGLKLNAGAEINRMLEIYVRPVTGWSRDEATWVSNTFNDNYGVAGAQYIQALVAGQSRHREMLQHITRKIDEKTGATADERFWSALAGTALYGGLLASQLGLIDFPLAPVTSWVEQYIKAARKSKKESVYSQIDILGQFLDENMAFALITSDSSKQIAAVHKEPKGAIAYRINMDTQMLFVSCHALKKYLEHRFGSFQQMKEELIAAGAMYRPNGKRVLGHGTIYGGTAQPCWEIDLKCPALGRKVMTLVKAAAPQAIAGTA